MSINLLKVNSEVKRKVIDYISNHASDTIIDRIDSSITVIYTFDDILDSFAVTTIDFFEQEITNNGYFDGDSFESLKNDMEENGIEEIHIDTLKSYYDNNDYYECFADGITTSFEEIENIMYFA